MAWGLGVYNEGVETLFTRRLINLFYGISFQYPPVPKTSTQTRTPIVTTKTFTIPAHTGTLGWVTQPIRQPIDKVVRLGGPTDGKGYRGTVYTGVLTSISVSGRTVTIKITTRPGNPKIPTSLSFLTRGVA